MNPLWYLSFAGDDGWLGGCYVPGKDEGAAVTEAWARGCNPGGEVQLIPLPPDMAERVPEEKIGVLLDREGREVE